MSSPPPPEPIVVVVANFVGATNSDYAILSVNTNPVAPSFTSQPVSQIVLTGGTASFNAVAVGTANHQLPME